MKKSIKILLVAVSASLALSGCIKETFPSNSTASADQVAGSESGLQAMVSALGAQMTTFNTLGSATNSESHWDFGYPAASLMRELWCNDMATYLSSYHQFANWETNLSMSADYAASRFMWTFHYNLIYMANSVLVLKSEGEFAGVARCYRAMAYLDMVRMYDFKANDYTAGKVDLSVPIVIETTSQAQAENNPRAATKAVYELIEGDLLAAEVDLANFARSSKNTPDKTVVWGLLARTYLEMGTRFSNTEYYAKAAQYARKVIAEGGYRPLSEAQLVDKTAGFNSSTSQSSWMWSVNITKEADVVATGICNFVSMISSEATFGYALAAGKESPQKCIDKKFYQSIPATDIRKQLWIAPDYSNASMAISGKAWAEENLAPYAQLKFRPAQGNISEYLVAASADFPMMRVEEMYLIEAEAKGLSGGDGRGLLEAFVTGFRDPAYAYDGSKSLSENVLTQKRIELWGEGLVFFDYKRLNKGLERGYAGTNHYDATRFNTTGVAPWFNVCINLREMNSNRGITPADNNPDPSGKVSIWEE